MTRRDAILIGIGIPASGFAAGEFWNQKKPEAWSEEEREQLLTKSPWAKEAEVKYNSGPGSLGGPAGRTNIPTRGSRRGGAAPVGIPSAPSANGNYQAIVRWESALPIRDASRNRLKDDPAANYILGVSGDLPMLGRRSVEETEAEMAQRLDMLKQYTKLEKRGDPIYLVKIGYANFGTLFYFERNDLIRPGDHQVTFVTKLGPIDVKAKFPLHDMTYQGKLEL